MLQSVVTVVGGRHDDADHLALATTQGPATVHELAVELEVLAHHPAVNAVDLDDVVVVRNAFGLGDLFLGKVANEGHTLRTLEAGQTDM